MGCGSSVARAGVLPATRGAQRQTSAPTAAVPSLPKGYAVLFAVDEYTRLLPLRGAVEDAKALEKVLGRLGFEVVVTLHNTRCTPVAVERTLTKVAEDLPEQSRLFVFFAGHGVVHAHTGRVFYCTPQTHPERLPTTGFDLEKIHSLRDFLPRQQLWVFDFCFSGGAVVRSRGARVDYRAFAAPCVQFISAGTADQLVSEIDLLAFTTDSPLCTPFGTPTPSPRHNAPSPTTTVPRVPQVPRVGGLFALVLVRILTALAEERDRRDDARPLFVPATEIFLRVRRKVLRSSESMLAQLQTPQMNRGLWWRDERADGDFVF